MRDKPGASIVDRSPSKQGHEQRRELRREAADRVQAGEYPGDVAASMGRSLDWVHNACREYDVKQPHRRRSPTSLKILARLWDTGSTLRQIASEFGVSPQWVSQIHAAAIEAGIPVPRRGEARERNKG